MDDETKQLVHDSLKTLARNFEIKIDFCRKELAKKRSSSIVCNDTGYATYSERFFLPKLRGDKPPRLLSQWEAADVAKKIIELGYPNVKTARSKEWAAKMLPKFEQARAEALSDISALF